MSSVMQIKSLEDYYKKYQESVDNPEIFWERIAETFFWRQKWNNVFTTDFENAKNTWFENGKLNITENALDRHLKTQPDKVAIIWEPNEPSDTELRLTYKELHSEVCKFANALKSKGIKKGDNVCFYMSMVPQLTIAILACARIGAVHSVVFAGFSSNALANRINDAQCKMVITCDGSYRGEKQISLKEIVDKALEDCPSIKNTIILKRTHQDIKWNAPRDNWYHELIENESDVCEAEIMDAEDPLFILYTSGSTGKPKGVVHTCGGYMVYAEYSFRNVFQYKEDDIYWCTADIGWITGHSYIIYGPLLAGATSVMFEGVPTYPDVGRFWQIVDKYKITLFYTAPTAIRALEACDIEFVKKRDLSSLRVLGTVGEPINEEAWEWYHKNIGKENCPIVDTWWQTETGGIMISPLAGITPLKPAYATLPLPGIQLALLDVEGNELKENGVEGILCIKHPWPSMLRTTYGNHQRCIDTYFAPYKGYYFTGDACKRDEDGYYRILGRMDDVINVSGHRFGTAEIENAINEHPLVVESAVVGYPHDIKGQGIYAYVCFKEDTDDKNTIKKEIIELVSQIIGPIAKPDKIHFTEGLPKTRSGKIMRRILRKIAENNTDNLGDISTLLNPEVVGKLKSEALVL